MSVPAPHYLLRSEARLAATAAGARRGAAGRGDEPTAFAEWRFQLVAGDGATLLDVAEPEPASSRDRLELLAVVRGLEALEQPSRVTLVTRSPFVESGLRWGLEAWRENGWQWEAYGRPAPVPHADLWRRIDRALQFHKIECRLIRIDSPPARRGDAAGASRTTAPRRTPRMPNRPAWFRRVKEAMIATISRLLHWDRAS